jgi:hypothetical protein
MRGPDSLDLTDLAAVASISTAAAFGLAMGFVVLRQSHLQAPPAEDAHLHCFDFIVFGISFFTLSRAGCANN